MTTRPLWRLTATEVLPLLRNGSLKVSEYTSALLARIQERDQQVKAWVYLDPAVVQDRARELDNLDPSSRGPLHGLPIGIKDTMLTFDMPTQHNSPLHTTTAPSTIDANTVAALRAQGAIIMGKTTTTEFAATTSANVHQNFTRNAHDQARTPGGSSSGSAAAVADYHVPVALGTQTGGSVVRPASFNGVWGLKFTWGAVSRDGMAQHSAICDTTGVFARCADDLELLTKALRVGDDIEDTTNTSNVAGSRIAFCKTHLWDEKAGPGLQKVWKEAQSKLGQAGATIECLTLPNDFAKVSKWHADIMAGDGKSSFLGAYLTDKGKLDSIIRGHVENRKGVSSKDLLDAYDGCARLRPIWDDLARQYDAVIVPSVNDEAPQGLEHTGDMVSVLDTRHTYTDTEQSFQAIWTIMHAPAVNIPGLEGEHGLPVGLTIVGPRFADRQSVRIARHLSTLWSA